MAGKRTTSAICAVIALLAPPAFAAIQRTFVSTGGLDTNPCTLALPCRSFDAAIAQTMARGEVYVLDSGGYGPAVIGSSISIRAEGVSAGISVFPSGTTVGILVNAGASDVVTLHGLLINSLGGNSAISFGSGAALHVEDIVVSNFAGPGIDMTAAGQLFLTDVLVRDNTGQAGLWVHPATGSAEVSADRTRFEQNGTGLLVYDNGRVIVRDSIAVGNATGLAASATSGPAELMLEDCVASENTIAIEAGAAMGTTAIVRLSNVTVTNNAQGLLVGGQGAIWSFGNNQVQGNLINGAPNATIPEM